MIPAIACVSRQLETSTQKFDGLPAHQAPYLVLAKGGCNCEHRDHPTFLSVSDGNIYHCNISSLTGKMFVGAHYGWLGLVDQLCEPSIVNPITGKEISLPSITTLSYVYPSCNSDGSLDYYYVYCDFYERFFKLTSKRLLKSTPFTKIIFSADPSSSTDFTVAAIHMYDYKLDLLFTKPNEGKWSAFKFEERFMDLTFREENKILALTGPYGVVYLITLDEKHIMTEKISGPFVIEHNVLRYLVDNSEYGIMQVVRDIKFTTRPITRAIIVLRLVVDGRGDKTWKRVKSLDGGVIFIGAGATTFLPRDKVCGAIRPNSVYFTDDCWDLFQESRQLDRDIGRYSLKDDSFEFFPRNFYHVTWPPPIWFH